MDIIGNIMDDMNTRCTKHIPGEQYQYKCKGNKERSRRVCINCGKSLSIWSKWM